jgi:hypothetical protein
MSKVARPTASATTATRRQVVPTNGRSNPSQQRRMPPPEYTVSIVENNGIQTTVLTIEDTPDPVAGPSGTRHGSPNEGSSSKSKKFRVEENGDHSYKLSNGLGSGGVGASTSKGSGGKSGAGPYEGYSNDPKSYASKNKRKLETNSEEASHSRRESGSSRDVSLKL